MKPPPAVPIRARLRTTTISPRTATSSSMAVLSDIEAFANFMRMLAPSGAGAPATPSTINGRAQFISIGCADCHTPSFTTGAAIASGSSRNPSPALSGQQVNLYSDLLVHHMGQDLADGISQGAAGPDEFRTAPLWGLGQRVSSCTTAGPAICSRPSRLTTAQAARPPRSCEGSTVLVRSSSRICSISCALSESDSGAPLQLRRRSIRLPGGMREYPHRDPGIRERRRVRRASGGCRRGATRRQTTERMGKALAWPRLG